MNTDYNSKMNYLKKRLIQNVLIPETNNMSHFNKIKSKKEEEDDFLFINYILVIFFLLFFFSLIKLNV